SREWARDPVRGAGADFRALLSRAGGSAPSRQRSGAANRRGDGGAARRSHLGGERAGTGRDVCHRVADAAAAQVSSKGGCEAVGPGGAASVVISVDVAAARE